MCEDEERQWCCEFNDGHTNHDRGVKDNSVHNFTTELDYCKLSAQWVLKMLTYMHKRQKMGIFK